MPEPTTATDNKATVETETEELDKSTDTGADKTTDAPSDSAADAAADDDKATDEDKANKSGKDEGADSSPTKKENKEGYRLRQITQRNDQLTEMQAKLQTGYVDEAEDDEDRRIRQVEADRYIEKVERAQSDILRDNEQAAREIPLFNANSDQFSKDLLDRALATYARDQLIVDETNKDRNGNPIVVGYRMRLLDYLREKAEDYGVQSKISNPEKPKPKKQSNAEMDAAADTPGGSSDAISKNKEVEDPFLKGFNDPYGRHTPEGAHKYST